MDDYVKLGTEGSNQASLNSTTDKLLIVELKNGKVEMLPTECLDMKPPILESEIDFKHEDINEDLPPPKLELVDTVLKFDKDIKNLLDDYETSSVPKKLVVKLFKQKLVPKKLTIQLPKVKEIEILNDQFFNRHPFPGELRDTKKLEAHDSLTFNCAHCTFKTKVGGYFQKHLHLHTPKGLIQCHVCSELFETVQFLKNHLYQNHVVKELKLWLKCESCPYKTTRKSEFRNHIKYSHQASEKPFKCRFCDFRASAKYHLPRHELTHKDPSECVMYTCEECGYKTKFRHTLPRHRLIHTKLELSCSKCTYKGKNRMCLNAHMKMHNKVYKTCPTCKKTVDKRFLQMHVMTHRATKEDMLRCVMCSYTSLYPGNMERHEKRHKSEKQLVFKRCTDCSYRTTDSGNLKRHYITIHSPDSNYSCERCDFSTNHKSSWQLHVTTQHTHYSKRKKLKCPSCSRQFLTTRGLQIHITISHKSPEEVTRYKCMHCPYSSLIKQSLKQHMRARHDEKYCKFKTMYRCLGCKYEIREERIMEDHIQEHHSQECQYEACEVPITTRSRDNIKK